MVMQSQGGIELVAELPQCLKKQDGYQVRRRLRGDQPERPPWPIAHSRNC